MKNTLTDTEINNMSVPLCAVNGQNGVVNISLSVNSNEGVSRFYAGGFCKTNGTGVNIFQVPVLLNLLPVT